MALFSIEHGKLAYWADFAVQGLLVLMLAGALVARTPPRSDLRTLGCVAAGLAAWSLAEYLLHRFVLHGLQPFQRWHALHHARPQALIGTPTALSLPLLGAVAFLPAWWAFGRWPAVALVLGVFCGYLAYGLTHHATHHWRARGGWLARRKQWHARHHHRPGSGCYGVTTGLWDHLLGPRTLDDGAN